MKIECASKVLHETRGKEFSREAGNLPLTFIYANFKINVDEIQKFDGSREYTLSFDGK